MERLRRVDPDLHRQSRPGRLVTGERVRLTTRSVEGQHEQAGKPLVVRVLPRQRLELGYDLVGAAECQPRLHSRRDRGQPELLDPGELGLREVLEPRVGERAATPEPKRLVEQLACPPGVVACQLQPCLPNELLETL